MGQGSRVGGMVCTRQTKYCDPNEAVFPARQIGTNGLYQIQETQGEAARAEDTILSHGG